MTEYRIECIGCHRRLTETVPGWYRHVTGWEQVRSKGGLHALKQRKWDGKALCGACMDEREHGPQLFAT